MRNDDGDIDITEYLARLPDQGRCLTAPHDLTYITDQGPRYSYSNPDLPRVTGLGPVLCSPCVQIELSPLVIWDTNGYYRDLGFSFPYRGISKKDLRLAFMERDGPNSERLMYVFKSLIDPDVRRKYDATPLGAVYMDLYWTELLHKRALQEAARRAGNRRSDDGTVPDDLMEEVLAEWGLGTKSQEGYSEASSDDESGEDSPSETDESEEPVQVPWNWSYYVWRSVELDTDKLALWQQMLISCFNELQIRHKFAVGYLGERPHPYLRVETQGRMVYFLNEDSEPTEELAARAAQEYWVEERRRKYLERSILP